MSKKIYIDWKHVIAVEEHKYGGVNVHMSTGAVFRTGESIETILGYWKSQGNKPTTNAEKINVVA